MSVTVELARELLDLGARLRRPGDKHDPPQAVEQLRGAVAIHNILQREGVAYLADEVGMGKTYVALGAIALFRHFQPNFRVAVIAPRENIQDKWRKEWVNFTTHIVTVPDLRVKALHGGPARPLIHCRNLRQFVAETTVDPDRDFFLRLSSFSLGAGGEDADLKKVRDQYAEQLPWVADRVESLRSKREFKDSLAKAVCCALPTFDLVVVDEAHNLKHGFAERSAARNRCLAFAFGRPSDQVDRRRFPDYGPRATRVLFLSATPLEDDYRQLWNQLDIFGKGEPYKTLQDGAVPESDRRACAQRFLVRRVTSLTVGDQKLTKNLYRREWRRGGLDSHDNPIRVTDLRQRLVVALVQKKVSELLNTSKFGSSFQTGMLASFESFLETARLKNEQESDGNFDDGEQTEDRDEREGIDVQSINSLAADYRKRFNGQELPHPKMDALVERLSDSWSRGRKSLVFLRRVASVWEVKERLDVAYNAWLKGRIEKALAESPTMVAQFQEVYRLYDEERRKTRARRLAVRMGAVSSERDGEQDRGGDDTFFAWYFRGEGPRGWLSGASFSQRFVEAGYELSTFFEDNFAADLLGVPPGDVPGALARAIGMPQEAAVKALDEHALHYLTQAKEPGRRELFDAAQGAAVDMLRTLATDEELRDRAEIVWRLRFEKRRHQDAAGTARAVSGYLTLATFFTAMRDERWDALRRVLWPEPSGAFADAFRERELRRELLRTQARLGHSFVDLYLLAMRQRGTLRTGGGEASESASEAPRTSALGDEFITQVLEMLDTQRQQLTEGREWTAFDELADAAQHFDLILDVNEPGVRSRELVEAGRVFGALLRQQQPVGGMTGQVNKTLVRQFRMPGYPLVLLSTDLLQEGEDLHTFCAEVLHYGLAWMPSSIEQRIGRVDRVRSKTERAAARAVDTLQAESRLQVYYPHLEETVERLQVRRVLRRMHEFIRLTHEGLATSTAESSRLNVGDEMSGSPDVPDPIDTVLKTSFPVNARDLTGTRTRLAVTAQSAREVGARLAGVTSLESLDGGRLPVTWDLSIDGHSVGGMARLDSNRTQHFVLHLDSFGERVVVRCVSPVGRLTDGQLQRAKALSTKIQAQIGVIEEADDRGCDLTVEEEVLLGDPKHDARRMCWLARRVVLDADRLEHALFNGADHGLEAFGRQLAAEGRIAEHAERTR